MTALTRAYESGRDAALARFKLATTPKATNPTVAQSSLLRSQTSSQPPSNSMQSLQAPTSPAGLRAVFDPQEQGRTHIEPTKKLADDLCTTCRKPKHYGPCTKPLKTKPDGIPLKQADFNLGLSGSDPKFVGSGESGPSTSPHYHSATADSSLARARDGRPAVEQADTGFRNVDALRGMLDPASQPERMYGGLVKQQSWNLPGSETHSLFENRGPTVNPYEERLTRKSTPVGWGDEGKQRINRAFDQIDGAVDSTNMEGGWGAPSDGPAALG